MRLPIFIIASSLALSACARLDQPQINRPLSSSGYSLKSIEASKLELYKSIPPVVNASTTRHSADVFGFPGAPTDVDGDLMYRNGTRALRINKKFGFSFYQDESRMWGRTTIAPSASVSTNAPIHDFRSDFDVPSEARCVELAKSYVAEKGLAEPGQYTTFQVNVAWRNIAPRDNISPQIDQITQREVVFKRRMGNLVIQGPGSQISIFIGSKGDVVGAFVDWPELELNGFASTIPSDVAIESIGPMLKSQDGAIDAENRISRFDVGSVDLCYAGKLNNDGSRDIIPSYAFGGKLFRGDNAQQQTVKVSAIQDMALPWNSHVELRDIKPAFAPPALKPE